MNQVTRLKKQKQDLENRLREQEEELDDLAGQVGFTFILSFIYGPKLSFTCDLEIRKVIQKNSQVQQLEAGKVKLEADLNQVGFTFESHQITYLASCLHLSASDCKLVCLVQP